MVTFDFFDPGFGYPYGQTHRLKEEKKMIESSESHCVYPEMLSHYLFTHNKLFIGDANKKEEKSMAGMSKEEALKKIEELKEYVERREEKEKEIPEMHRGALPKAQPAIVCPWMKYEDMPLWWKEIKEWMTFNEDDTFLTWGILAYELAQLMYAREYLKIDVDKYLRARKHGDEVFKIIFVVTECRYEVIDVFNHQVLNENDRVWCFTNEDDANRVRDYLNKYVAHVKRNMY